MESVIVVAVVQVLAVFVLVRHRLVVMRVAVRARGHRIVDVRVVAIVVRVQVLVAHRLVAVVMAVPLGRMQPDARRASAPRRAPA